MSSALTVDGLSSEVGSGEPPESMAVQTSTARTIATPAHDGDASADANGARPPSAGRLAVVTAAADGRKAHGRILHSD